MATKKPVQDSDMLCPQFQKELRECCHKCAWYILVRGTNPNDGKDVDAWDCAMAFVPLLLIENSQQQRHTAGEINAFRNEVDERAKRAETLAFLQGNGSPHPNHIDIPGQHHMALPRK